MTAEMIRGLLRIAQPLAGRSPGRTWLLGYHLVDGGTDLAIDISRKHFIDQLDLLSERADFISLRDLLGELNSDSLRQKGDLCQFAESPGRPRVVLTFDDAFLNFYDVVLPLLVDRSLSATLYVPSGFISGDGDHPLSHPAFRDLPPMSWAQLHEAVTGGVEIGSHTHRHTNLAHLPVSILADELRRSQAEIEQGVGVRPRSICYPRGIVSTRVALAAGRFYASGVTGGGRSIGPSRHEDLLRLPRLPVRRDISPEAFVELLEQPVCLEEWAADKLRQVRARVAMRG